MTLAHELGDGVHQMLAADQVAFHEFERRVHDEHRSGWMRPTRRSGNGDWG